MIGNLIIVAAPSGAGKSSLVNAVLAEDASLKLSVSHTTRTPRAGEEDGREYHFVGVDQFKSMVDKGVFLEYAFVHGNYYGTSRDWIAATRALDTDIVLEIDWQGAQQVRRIFPDTVSVFILPPSMDELERRLRGRDKDDEESIRQRMANAAEEIAHLPEFEYVIINDEFNKARADLAAIVRAARSKLAIQRGRHSRLFASFQITQGNTD